MKEWRETLRNILMLMVGTLLMLVAFLVIPAYQGQMRMDNQTRSDLIVIMKAENNTAMKIIPLTERGKESRRVYTVESEPNALVVCEEEQGITTCKVYDLRSNATNK
jgi:hypothetical protein